jgi:hypothetical protein
LSPDETILCRLEVVGEDAPHRGTKLEVRQRGAGFSVWFWNYHLCRRGVEIGASSQPYNVRALAQIIFEYDIRGRLYGHLMCSPLETISVTGERGLRAYSLPYVFIGERGSLLYLPDATLDAFDALVGDTCSHERVGLVDGIIYAARDLELDLDVPALLRRYCLELTSASLQPLRDALKREVDRREDERLAPLDPFADQIEWMLRAHRRTLRTTGSMYGDTLHSTAHLVREALEGHVREHGRLPTGRARLLKNGNPFNVDFDALAATVASACARLPLPKAYRLPRRKRVPFFRKQIEAMADCFESTTPEGDRWDVIRFLEDYVTAYERLPHGRQRINTDASPCPLGGTIWAWSISTRCGAEPVCRTMTRRFSIPAASPLRRSPPTRAESAPKAALRLSPAPRTDPYIRSRP